MVDRTRFGFSPEQASRKALVSALVVLVLALSPFALTGVGQEPFVLGLPWWYWVSMVFAVVMFAALYVYTDTVIPDEPYEEKEPLDEEVV